MTCAVLWRAALWPALSVVAVCWPHVLQAGDTESARPSLKGIPAFRVLVEKLGAKVEKEGVLNRDVLQADVEARLAEAGIKVARDAPALLYASVAVVCDRQNCAFNVALEVQLRVRLEQRPRAGTFIAPTWRTGITGLIGRQPELIRRNVRDQVDQFVAAYREANPAE
jgi:hypothetical protein